MRLAVVTQTRSKVGGAESYLEEVVAALARRHEVAFWTEHGTIGDRGPVMLPEGVELLKDPPGKIGGSLGAWKPDVLFGHGLHDAETERRVLGIAPAVVVEHTYHGTCITSAKTMHWPNVRACERTFGPACLALYFPRRCGGLNPVTMATLYVTQSRRLSTLRSTAAVVTLSAHMRDELLRHGLPPERVHVVLPFVHSPVVSAPEPRVSDVSELLFLGRLETLKGVDRLIDALPLVARQLERPVRLTVGGDGADRQRLESQAARVVRAGVAIDFAGWLDATGRMAALSRADALVVPSLWPEPFGLVGLEAAAAGVPAVAFATGGIPEWLTDNESGCLARPEGGVEALAAAIVRCVADPAIRARLAAGAIRSASRLTLDRHVTALDAILTAAASGRRATEIR